MNFGKRDLVHLRAPLIMLLLVLGTGGGILFTADRHLEELKHDQKLAERQLNDAIQKLAQVKHERDNIDQFYPKYQDLVTRGVVGEEKRLDWVETIENIRSQRQIFAMRYVISPQKSFTPTPGLTIQNFDLKASTMSVELNLLHEGQLLGFLDDLRQEVKGLYLVERCKVDRIGASMELRYAPQLRAECAFNWLTLKEKQ